ncbi:MAG: hypothetical protein Q4C13_02455 [Clostridia bacterium]|nr:hypothetical protein [Clostridia bacterium]
MDRTLGILIVAAVAVLFLLLSGLRRRRIQPYIDAFAKAFCEASDHLLGSTRSFGAIATEWTGGGLIRVLPAEEQPEALRALLERGVDDYVLERIRSMFELRAEAQKHLSVINLIGKKVNGVMNHVYDMANVSFSVINDQSILLKKEDLESFQQFLNKQAYIRNTTLASVVSEACQKEIAL